MVVGRFVIYLGVKLSFRWFLACRGYRLSMVGRYFVFLLSLFCIRDRVICTVVRLFTLKEKKEGQVLLAGCKWGEV